MFAVSKKNVSSLFVIVNLAMTGVINVLSYLAIKNDIIFSVFGNMFFARLRFCDEDVIFVRAKIVIARIMNESYLV